MQNNLNNRVFNPNDHTSWRWNDPVLANTPISEAEARQITQIARQLGGVITLLHTEGSRILPSLIEHNLNEAQQLIARRAAIVITAQQTHGIPLKNELQAIDAHRQIDSFFEGLGDNINLHPRQTGLIHKVIDSYFAAKEFRKGRLNLDSNIPSQKNLQKRGEISEPALIQFFKHIVENIPSDLSENRPGKLSENRYDYIRTDLKNPLQNNRETYVFINKAFDYLVQIYNGINYTNFQKENQPILILLNRLINNPAVTNAIKNAIIANIDAAKLGASFKHLQYIIEEDIIEEEAAGYINSLSGFANGIGFPMTNQILGLEKGITAVFDISKTSIRIESLCYAITINGLDNVDKINNYIKLVADLLNYPDSQAIDAGCLNGLLDFQEGALALRASRIKDHPLFKDEDASMLAKAFHTAITDPNYPANSKEEQAAYINLMAQVINQYLDNATSYTRMVKVGWSFILGVEEWCSGPENFIKEIFSRQEMCIILNRARVLSLSANSISSIIARNQDIENSLLLLNFVLDVIGANIQNVSAELVNDFIAKQNGAMDILNKASNVSLSASSIAHLIGKSNTHNDRIANLKLVTDLIDPQNKAAIRLDVNAMNRYLTIDGSPERINADRVQKISREKTIHTINQVNRAMGII